MNEIDNPRRVTSMTCLLSLVSCVSLLIFGAASLVFSFFGPEWSGILVGAALVVHGYYEFRQRDRFIRTKESGFASKLAWNQLALAVSVGIYLLWRYLQVDDQQLVAILARDPIRSFLAEMPPETTAELKQELPGLVRLSYATAALVVGLGCVAMAGKYWSEGRRLQKTDV